MNDPMCDTALAHEPLFEMLHNYVVSYNHSLFVIQATRRDLPVKVNIIQWHGIKGHFCGLKRNKSSALNQMMDSRVN